MSSQWQYALPIAVMRSLIVGAFIAVVGLVYLILSFHYVQPNQMGVLIQDGRFQQEAVSPGMHWTFDPLNDGFDTLPANVFEIRAEQLSAATRDGQNVADASVVMELRIDPKMVGWVRQALGENWRGELRSTLTNQFNNTTGKFAMVEIGKKRAELGEQLATNTQQAIDKLLGRAEGGIEVVSAQLTSFSWDQRAKERLDKYAEAQAQKRIARQELEAEKIRARKREQKAQSQAEARLITARSEAEAKRVRAEAERDRFRMLSEVISPELARLEMVRKWNGELPMATGDGSSALIDLTASELSQRTENTQ